MDEIKEKINEINADLKEVKQTLVLNTIQLTKYNSELEVHIQGTRDLQRRIRPIEDHVIVVRKTFVGIAWLCGVAASVATILKLLWKI